MIRWVLATALLSATLFGCTKHSSDSAPRASTTAATATAQGLSGTWEVSTDQKSWKPVKLPDTDWKCDTCTRFYRTTVEGQPKSVRFRFASDNSARMSINGADAFSQFFKDNYCTEKPCCDECCDTPEHCTAHLSPWHDLDAAALARFHAGANTIVWEVRQESGGSGFLGELQATF